MRINEHSLRQLDDAYLCMLSLESLQDVSKRLLADLKEARNRLGRKSAEQFSSTEQSGGLGTGSAPAEGDGGGASGVDARRKGSGSAADVAEGASGGGYGEL